MERRRIIDAVAEISDHMAARFQRERGPLKPGEMQVGIPEWMKKAPSLMNNERQDHPCDK
jgi:hypothetical protein